LELSDIDIRTALESQLVQEKRLYRSKKNRILGGVCGGLGEYFGIDPNLIRLLWIALALVNGIGLVLYIIAWILIPEEGEPPKEPGELLVLLAIVAILLLAIPTAAGLWTIALWSALGAWRWPLAAIGTAVLLLALVLVALALVKKP